MVDSEVIKALQLIALQAAEDPTDEQFYRGVCRWYSEKYATPLHQVEDMDYYYVLQHYFEENYNELKSSTDKDANHQYDEIKTRLLYPEELKKKQEDDDDWVKKLEEEAKAQEAKDNPKQSKDLSNQTNTPTEQLNLPNELKLPDSGSYSE